MLQASQRFDNLNHCTIKNYWGTYFLEKLKQYFTPFWAWLQTTEATILFTVFCLPLGIVLIWRDHHLSNRFKQIITGLALVACVIGGAVVSNHIDLNHDLQRVSADSKRYHKRYNHVHTAYNKQSKDFADLQSSNDKYHAKMQPYEQLAAVEGKKRRADAAAASKVSEALDALPETSSLTLSNKSDLQSVRKAFNLLSKAQKELVDETLLKSDEAKMSSLEKAAKAAALAAQKQRAAAAAAAKKRAQEEARGYETGITYDQLARTPDRYTGKKVKFYGKVLQVLEDGDSVQVRLAVNDDYDKVMLCDWSSDTVSSRVLEDDEITVSGVSAGLVTYDSTMGGEITIPSMSVVKVSQ
ncbi:hypothetical protein [Lacticaseibacillus nasuensis]|uniref:hypothetical protein n=1 Tax=Lacticaseibacillus nasuensis TaxID=944671 RepID=UPI002AFF69CB|nr:hypothetical protein [Lacticaseibacillus nasuensis]